MKIKNSIEIHASIEKVFDYLSDIRNRSVFATDLDDFKLLTQQFKGIGTKYIERNKLFGICINNQFEVTKLIPNQLMVTQTKIGWLAIENHIQFTKKNYLTIITWSQKIRFNGWTKTIQPFIKEKITRQLHQDLENLKVLLDVNVAILTSGFTANSKFWI